MITVTRINGAKLSINALLIETIEETPDTIITLTNGRKFMVTEKMDTVIHYIHTYISSLGVIQATIKCGDMEE